VLAWLAPRPAQQAEPAYDTEPADDRPKRTACHERALNEIEALPEPHRAGHDEQRSKHASGDCHATDYRRLEEAVLRSGDTFETEEGRQAHLNGEIPQALGQVGPDLLASDPDIRPVDVIAVK
jgi:hypothetical protein